MSASDDNRRPAGAATNASGRVAQQERLIKSLRETLAKMEIALGSLEEPIVFSDGQGRIEWCNQPFSALVAKEKLALLGTPLVDSLPFSNEGKRVSRDGHPVTRVTGEGQSVDVVREMPSDQGAPRLVRIIGHYVDHGVAGGQGVFVVRDVTISQRELRRDRLAALGSLTRGMIHQINSPLGAVRSNIEYLRDELETGQVDSETIQELLGESLESVDRISSLFESVNTFGSSDPNRFELFDLARSVEAAARLSRGHWDTVADVQIPPPRAKTDVYGDPASITQALAQLFANAAWAVSERSTLESQIETSYRGKITITLEALGDWTILEVIDNGIGVPDSIRESIFEPFFTTRSGMDAAGQGLYVARTIIEDLHGGSLRLAEPDPVSDPVSHQGARFVVSLPSFVRE